MQATNRMAAIDILLANLSYKCKIWKLGSNNDFNFPSDSQVSIILIMKYNCSNQCCLYSPTIVIKLYKFVNKYITSIYN